MELVDLGFSPFFESNWKASGLDRYSIARVVAEYKGSYRVRNASNEYLAKVTGKRMFNALSREDYPAVGDWVAIAELDSEQALIHEVLPRKTILMRKYSNKEERQVIATNIDIAFVVESVDRDYSLNRFERYFAIVTDGNIKPAIVLNKIDLIPRAALHLKTAELKNRFNSIAVIPTSTITNEGLEELSAYIEKGNTYCFLGSSGVGKSSLINKLLGRDEIKIGEISKYSNRGKHITASREMYFLGNGGIVIDNPGMREIGMTDSSAGAENVFLEIADLSKKCKYRDCTHTQEPGCAVLKAIELKELDENKYRNYLKLIRESEYYKITNVEKRSKDRKFGKIVKKALEKKKKYRSYL